MSLLAAAQGIVNATSPLPWLVVAGQPSQAQLESLAAAGLQAVIDIRESMEAREIDEPAVANSLQLKYINVPIVSGALSDEMMDRVLEALRESKGVPTLLHCNSANRTGGPLIAWLMTEEKMPEADAVDLAMRSGLRSVEYLEWATEYARRRIDDDG